MKRNKLNECQQTAPRSVAPTISSGIKPGQRLQRFMLFSTLLRLARTSDEDRRLRFNHSGVVQLVALQTLDLAILVRVQAPEPSVRRLLDFAEIARLDSLLWPAE